MIEISAELESLRQKLLDLTLRNKLIHHFPSKKRTIEVIDESPRELYDILVLQEKSMRFKPTKINDEIEEEQEDNGDEKPHMWIEPDHKDEEHKHFFDLYINTPYDYEKLMDRLFYTYNQSHSFFEEQGYSVLYLAIGFLEWKETSNAQKVIKSPLILIPVELSRIGKRRDFSLTWTGDDIVTSLTLQGKLSEGGVELPDFNMPDDKSGIDQYFHDVRKSVQNQTDWIISDKIVLDFFNFRKYLMYKDLDPATWPSDRVPATHPLIQSIFNPQPTGPSDYIINDDEVDTKIKSSSSLVVLDADSSQLAAIEAIKGKKNLVVQGPPGTGKSQTIANLIAELIGLGKSVLFVSEKMAALEVVKKRLDNVGLGIFCLELHSNKAKKTEVLKELQKTLTLRGSNTFSNDHEIDELDDIKKQLNTYVTVLHAPFGRRNLSPYALFSLKAKVELYFQKLNRKMKIIPISNPETISQEQWSHAVSNLEKTIGLVGMLPAFKDNPWKLCSPNIILPPDKEVIRSDICESIEKYNILLKNLNIISELTGIPQAATKTDIIKIKEAIDILDNHPPVTRAMLSNDNWNNTQLVKGLIQDISVYQSEREEFLKSFNYTIIDKDYKEHIKNYDSLIERLKVELASSYPQSQIPQKMCEMHKHLRLCVQKNILKKKVIDFDQYGKSFFDNYWLGIRSDPEQLECILKIIGLCQNWKRSNILPENAFYILESGFNPDFIISGNIADKLNLASNAVKLLEKHQILHKKVSSTFKPDIIDLDVEKLKSQFEYQSSLFLRSLRPGYRSLKKQLSDYYSISPPSDDTRLLDDVSQVMNYNQTKKLMTTHKAHLRQLFGRYWNDNTTDPKLLRDYIKLIKLFNDDLEGVNSTYLHIFDSGLHQDVLKNPSLHYQMNDIEKVISSLNDYHNTDTILKETGLNFVEEANYDGIYSDIEYYIDTIQKEVGPFYINNDCSDVDTVIAQLKKIDALQERSKEIINNHNGRDLFGEHWKGIDSEPSHLQKLFDWITTFRKYWHSGIFTELTIGKVDSKTIEKELPQLYQNIEKYDDIFNDSIVHLSNVLKFSIPEVFGEEYGLVEYKTIIRQLEIWYESIDILDKWSHYLDYRNKLSHSVALPLIEHIENESILSQDALYTLEGNYADGVLKQVFRQYPVMTEFIGELHNQKIDNFRLLDERFIENNRKRLYSRMSSAI
ncbi:MAG TPA: hypothetical protein DDX29_02480, partial [Clostridiales bacterium]|nr:hypothetical protein [Clostridiales bacterium]